MCRVAMIALVWAIASGMQAPGTTPELTGVVRGEDGSPVPLARVMVVTAGRGGLTDAGGRFAIREVAAGRHRVEVTSIGYAPGFQEIVIPGGGERVVLEVVLRASPLSLPGVQVTGSPTAREAIFGTQATTQLQGRALDRSLAGSVAQTLAEQPGIGIRYNGPGAAAPLVRGLGGDRILILQDGQRAGDLAGSADDHGVTIDPLAAQRIEVVRGPAALMYGNNALGGVVNVITGEAAGAVPAVAEGAAAIHTESAFPGAGVLVRTTVPLSGRTAVTLRGGGRGTGDARIGGDPAFGRRLPNTSRRSGEGAGELNFIGRRVGGTLGLRAFGFDYGVPLPPEEPGEIRLRGRILATTARAEVAGGRIFSSYRISGSVQDYYHEEVDAGRVEMAFGLRTQTLEMVARQGLLGPFREGAWGVSGLFRQYTATGAEQLTAPADTRALGLFVFEELPLGLAGAALQLGARADHLTIASRADPRFGAGSRRSFPAGSGSIGIAIPVGEGVALAGSAARSFRAPTVEELFSDALHVGAGAYEIGDPALRAERATGIEAIFRVQRATINGELAVYRNQVRDFVHIAGAGETTIDGTQWPVHRYVQADARLTGAEGFLEWAAGRQLVVGVRGDRVLGERADGAPLPFIPATRLGGSTRWEAGSWSAGGSGTYTFAQRRVGLEDEYPTEGYLLLSFDAGVRHVRSGITHSVAVRVENLTDRLYRDAASRIKAFAPNPGRNVSVLYRIYF